MGTTHIVLTKKSELSISSSIFMVARALSHTCGNGVLIYDSGMAGGRPKVMLSVLRVSV